MQDRSSDWYLPVGFPFQKVIAISFPKPDDGLSNSKLHVPGTSLNNINSVNDSSPLITNDHYRPQYSMATLPPQQIPHNSHHLTQKNIGVLRIPEAPFNCANTSTASHLADINLFRLNAHLAIQTPELQSSTLPTTKSDIMPTMSLQNIFMPSNSHMNYQPLQMFGQYSTPMPQISPAIPASHLHCLPPTTALYLANNQYVSPLHNFNGKAELFKQNINSSKKFSKIVDSISSKTVSSQFNKDKEKQQILDKRKADDSQQQQDLKKAKLETRALKAKRPGFTDDRYNETSYYMENGLRKVYPYYFTFTTFTKGRWVGEKILDVFAREFRAHPTKEYERCIETGTLTVNYQKVPIDYRLKHNDLLANIVHRHEVPVTNKPIKVVHMDDDIVVVDKPASIPVHPCGRYRHNTIVFILAKEYNLKNLRTIHRLDRLTSGLLLFGRSSKKTRQMEHQIRNRQVQKEYICRVEGKFPDGIIECNEPIEVISYKIGVCKVSKNGKDCKTSFQKISNDNSTSIVLCKPRTGRMHQIRVHLQYLGFPVVNDPLYNHEVFGPLKGRDGDVGGKTDEELIRDLINIHNAENWLGSEDNDSLSKFGSLTETKNPNIFFNDEKPEISQYESKTSILEENNSVNASNTIKSPVLISDSTNPHKPILDQHQYIDIDSSTQDIDVSTQTGYEPPDFAFDPKKMTIDNQCYECNVRYRDPKPNDLIMYLHAWTYKGPDWEYKTELPSWANFDVEKIKYDN